MKPTKPIALLAATTAAALGACADDPGLATRTQLVQYQTCSQLETDLEDAMIAQLHAQIDQYGGNGWGGPETDGDAPSSGDAGDSGDGRQEGEDFSGTNNQEDGVDEADFLKTDGYYIYTLNGRQLRILAVPEFGQLEPVSATDVEGHPTQMLVDSERERAVVFSIVPVYDLPEQHPLRAQLGDPDDQGNWTWRTWDVTKVTVLDISDRAAPSLLREVYLEGWYQTARKHDASVRLAAYSYINNSVLWNWYSLYAPYADNPALGKLLVAAAVRELTLDELVPRYYTRTPDGALAINALTDEACGEFYRPTNSSAYGMTSLYSLDLAEDDLAVDADTIVSNWPTVYASSDQLVLTEPAHGWWWFWDNDTDPEQLNVHAFDISTPGETTYLASGRVEGLLFDQFSIDEHDGTIRLATTDNRWSRWWTTDAPPPDNHVWVLEQQGDALETIGHVGGIAPNESIFAARFLDDRAFLVTFEQVDPLFTIDLRDPTAPTVVGELKVPGFSTYLHPIAEDRLLAIGVGGDEAGASWGQTQVSMFDASDFANPALQDTLSLQAEGDWSWSEAQYEHKAFQYWAPKGLLAVPVSTYSERVTPEGYYAYSYLSRLDVIDVDVDAGLSLRGSIDHSALYRTDQYWYYRDIRRSIFMGDYLYAVSDRGITVHQVSDLAEVTRQELPGYTEGDWWWWW